MSNYDEKINIIGLKAGFLENSPYAYPILSPFIRDEAECDILLALPGTAEDLAEKTGYDLEYVREKLVWLNDLVGLCIQHKRPEGWLYTFHSSCTALKDNMTYHLLYIDDNPVAKDPEHFITKEKVKNFMCLFTDWTNTEHVDGLWEPRDAAYKEAMETGNRTFKSPVIRVIPLPGTVKDGTKLHPCEDFDEICRNSDEAGIYINDCACNWSRHNVTGKTNYEDNYVCLHMSPYGSGIQFEKYKLGNRLTVDEAIEHGKKVADRGLVMTANGGRAVVAQVCCCQSQGCSILRPIYQKGLHSCWESRFVPEVDNDKCIGCGKCAKRCPLGCISMVKDMEYWEKEGKARLIPEISDKCFGCGACVMGCQKDAIGLKCVRDESWLVDCGASDALDDPYSTGTTFTSTN